MGGRSRGLVDEGAVVGEGAPESVGPGRGEEDVGRLGTSAEGGLQGVAGAHHGDGYSVAAGDGGLEARVEEGERRGVAQGAQEGVQVAGGDADMEQVVGGQRGVDGCAERGEGASVLGLAPVDLLDLGLPFARLEREVEDGVLEEAEYVVGVRADPGVGLGIDHGISGKQTKRGGRTPAAWRKRAGPVR